MERLTYRYGNNHAVPTKIALDFVFGMDKETFDGLTEIFDRLDAYEKTGLEPDEVKTAVTFWGENTATAQAELQAYRALGTVERMTKLSEAEQKRRDGCNCCMGYEPLLNERGYRCGESISCLVEIIEDKLRIETESSVYSIKIQSCPMCGRDLKGESHDGNDN